MPRGARLADGAVAPGDGSSSRATPPPFLFVDSQTGHEPGPEVRIVRSSSILSKIACGAAAGTGAALLVLLLDGAMRTRWGAGIVEHASATLPLVVFLGTASGAALGSLVGGWSLLTGMLGDGRRRELAERAGAALAVAAAAAAALHGVTPNGKLRESVVARLAPWGVALVLGGAAWVWTGLARSRSARARAALLLGSIAAGAALFWLDAVLLVGTHRRLHAVAEGIAVVVWMAALGSVAYSAYGRSARAASIVSRATAAAAVLSPLWLVTQLAGGAPFANVRHLLHEPTALGGLVTDLVKLGTPPPPPAVAVEDRWSVGEQEPLAERVTALNLRADCTDCNIIVYLVDTLRADIASDPRLMPGLTGFAAQSLSFVQAYSTASDTLQALPTLLAGRYDARDARTFLEQARLAKVDTALFIPASARDYLEAHLPAFRFDETSVVADHSEDKPVWGYGADIPTGDEIAERAVEWIAGHRDRRFLAWVYNFDLHGWRDLRDDLLTPRPNANTSPEDRYRLVAQAVDRSFARVLAAVHELGLEERTIVLFVSDHGEALGYRGFAAHSAFLWQPLVRVPLIVRIPGLEPRAVARQVSIVDVAPTLARFVEPSGEHGPYHGLDLLRLYANPETERSLPILLRASSDGRPSMLGLVDPTRKLVVPAGGGPPQLHDLTVDDPDDTDLTEREAEHASKLLGDLASSPLSFE